MDLKISLRGEKAPASAIRKLTPLADAAKARGIEVYHINIGQPDFEVPPRIKEELQRLAKKLSRLPYSPSKGVKELVTAWQEYYRQVGIELDEEEILVTSGGSEALILAAAAIFNPGEEMLVFEPFYTNYRGVANLLSVGVRGVVLKEENSFHLPKLTEIEKAVTEKTRAIFLTNPNNPTGTVFTREELESLLKIARRYNLFIVADETYRGICFDGHESVSILNVASEEDKERVVICDSLSKRLNICGARVGVVVSKNRQLMDAVGRFAQARLSVATLEQLMVVPMLKDSLGYVSQITKEYQRRRDVFLESLEKELGVKIHRPEGAFYTMISLPIDDSELFARWLLTDFSDKNETVMVAPGSGFYVTPGMGKKEVRVAYVLEEKKLRRAAELLGLAVRRYQEEMGG